MTQKVADLRQRTRSNLAGTTKTQGGSFACTIASRASKIVAHVCCVAAQRSVDIAASDLSDDGRPHMRIFETAASTALVLAAQALVVGVVFTTL
ncbi:MAG: hypothetical protein PGN23_05145 [Sphingomonas adhaesiva]|uniref:hypothetical protein n=1 Tax=Sphingomonas adhaesiva TaxID=28212 RepID=UPI002FF67497